MTREEHIERHKLLHKHLDELLADFIDNTGKMPSKTTLLEFLNWSYSQTTDPAEIGKKIMIKPFRNKIKRFFMWCSDHRYILCMNPKGWTEQEEEAYQKWASKKK